MSTPSQTTRRCEIELVALGHGERCPGRECALWEKGCFLGRVQGELVGRPEVALLLLRVRRELEQARSESIEFDDRVEADNLFRRRLAAGSE